jgi:hypothetical protein
MEIYQLRAITETQFILEQQRPFPGSWYSATYRFSKQVLSFKYISE